MSEFLFICVYLSINVRACVFVCMHVCVSVCVSAAACAGACACACVYTFMYQGNILVFFPLSNYKLRSQHLIFMVIN